MIQDDCELIEGTTLDEFATRCARRVADEIRSAVKARGKCVLALAGGSSPTKIHQALAQSSLVGAVPWNHVQIVFGDERAVPPDSPDSNYGNAQSTLLTPCAIDAVNVHPMRAWTGDLQAEARRYDSELCALTGGGPLAEIDLLMLGVGEDAHIFSLYPECPVINDNPDCSVVAIEKPPMRPPHERLSLTPRALEHARSVMVLFVGAKKRAAYDRYRATSGSDSTSPVRLVHRARGTTIVGLCLQ